MAKGAAVAPPTPTTMTHSGWMQPQSANRPSLIHLSAPPGAPTTLTYRFEVSVGADQLSSDRLFHLIRNTNVHLAELFERTMMWNDDLSRPDSFSTSSWSEGSSLDEIRSPTGVDDLHDERLQFEGYELKRLGSDSDVDNIKRISIQGQQQRRKQQKRRQSQKQRLVARERRTPTARRSKFRGILQSCMALPDVEASYASFNDMHQHDDTDFGTWMTDQGIEVADFGITSEVFQLDRIAVESSHGGAQQTIELDQFHRLDGDEPTPYDDSEIWPKAAASRMFRTVTIPITTTLTIVDEATMLGDSRDSASTLASGTMIMKSMYTPPNGAKTKTIVMQRHRKGGDGIPQASSENNRNKPDATESNQRSLFSQKQKVSANGSNSNPTGLPALGYVTPTNHETVAQQAQRQYNQHHQQVRRDAADEREFIPHDRIIIEYSDSDEENGCYDSGVHEDHLTTSETDPFTPPHQNQNAITKEDYRLTYEHNEITLQQTLISAHGSASIADSGGDDGDDGYDHPRYHHGQSQPDHSRAAPKPKSNVLSRAAKLFKFVRRPKLDRPGKLFQTVQNNSSSNVEPTYAAMEESTASEDLASLRDFCNEDFGLDDSIELAAPVKSSVDLFGEFEAKCSPIKASGHPDASYVLDAMAEEEVKDLVATDVPSTFRAEEGNELINISEQDVQIIFAVKNPSAVSQGTRSSTEDDTPPTQDVGQEESSSPHSNDETQEPLPSSPLNLLRPTTAYSSVAIPARMKNDSLTRSENRMENGLDGQVASKRQGSTDEDRDGRCHEEEEREQDEEQDDMETDEDEDGLFAYVSAKLQSSVGASFMPTYVLECLSPKGDCEDASVKMNQQVHADADIHENMINTASPHNNDTEQSRRIDGIRRMRCEDDKVDEVVNDQMKGDDRNRDDLGRGVCDRGSESGHDVDGDDAHDGDDTVDDNSHSGMRNGSGGDTCEDSHDKHCSNVGDAREQCDDEDDLSSIAPTPNKSEKGPDEVEAFLTRTGLPMASLRSAQNFVAGNLGLVSMLVFDQKLSESMESATQTDTVSTNSASRMCETDTATGKDTAADTTSSLSEVGIEVDIAETMLEGPAPIAAASPIRAAHPSPSRSPFSNLKADATASLMMVADTVAEHEAQRGKGSPEVCLVGGSKVVKPTKGEMRSGNRTRGEVGVFSSEELQWPSQEEGEVADELIASPHMIMHMEETQSQGFHKSGYEPRIARNSMRRKMDRYVGRKEFLSRRDTAQLKSLPEEPSVPATPRIPTTSSISTMPTKSSMYSSPIDVQQASHEAPITSGGRVTAASEFEDFANFDECGEFCDQDEVWEGSEWKETGSI